MITMGGYYVNSLTGEMLQSLYKNEKYIAKNNWQDAEKEIETIADIWNKNRVCMSMLFNHTVIDKIDASIAKIKSVIQMKEKEEFFYEKSNLDLLLVNLKEQQKISIGNIL